MSVKIRLKRQGNKKRPKYMIVAIDKNRKREGIILEKLGYYYPKKETDKKVELNKELFNEWIKKGAEVSQTVKSLSKISK